MGKFLFFKGVVLGILFFSSQNVYSKESEAISDCAFTLGENADLYSEAETRAFWREITSKAPERLISEETGYLRKSFELTLLALRRTFVVALGVGSVIGTGMIAKQYTDQDNIATGLMLIVTPVVLKLMSPVDRRVGPVFEKAGHIIWGPGKQDVWGRIMSSLNENEREKAQQIYSQLIVIDRLLEKAKKAIKNGKIKKAANKYISIFSLSRSLFAMLHLDDPATLIMVQSELPKKISREVFDTLIKETEEGVNLLSRDDLDELRISREDFRDLAFDILHKWFDKKIVEN